MILREKEMPLSNRLIAEFMGTAWLVLCGCGSLVIASAFPGLGIGFLGVALAFGLSLLTMIYTIGHISGCHINPAVSIGLFIVGRFPARDVLPYIFAQILGGIAGAGLLYLIASGKPGFDVAHGFAANGYGEHSFGGYSVVSAFITEAVFTFMLLMIILGSTDTRVPKGFAPIAIGLGLTLLLLVGIPVTGLSANPVRSTGPALFVGGWAIQQLWLFWVAPILGAVVAAVFYRHLAKLPENN